MSNPSTESNIVPYPAPKEREYNFKKGVSGNPNGRPKGSKNQITELRIGLEQALREQIGPDLAAVAAKAVEMAKQGDRMMIKMLLDLFISKPSPIETNDTAINRITLNVRTLELGEPKTIIDVTPEITPLPIIEENT